MSSIRDMFGNFGVPTTGGSVARPGPGELAPNSRAQNLEAGVDYQFVPVWPPFVRLANSPGIVYFPRFRTVIMGGNGALINATYNRPINFSVPTIVIARTGTAVVADNATALQVGRSALDTFTVQMFRAGSNSDFIDAGAGADTAPNVQTLGGCILGSGGLPALIPGNGIFIDTGSYLTLAVTALLPNLLIHVDLWCIEEYGPARG